MVENNTYPSNFTIIPFSSHNNTLKHVISVVIKPYVSYVSSAKMSFNYYVRMYREGSYLFCYST